MDLVGLGTTVTIVGLVFGSAAFFDRIASDQFKQQLADNLRGAQRHLNQRLPSVARIFISQTVGRLYPGDIISLRNVALSSGISVVSITLFSILVCYLNQINVFEIFDLTPQPWVSTKIFALVFILFGALAVDIFSCLQTAMFLNLIVRIRSEYDMLFMALCDVIITINLFIFIFPIGIQAWINANDIIGRDVGVYIELPSPEHQKTAEDNATTENETKEVAEAAAKYGMRAFEIAVLGYYGPTEETLRPSPQSPGIIATRDLSAAELLAAFFKSVGVKPQTHTGVLIDRKEDDPDIELTKALYENRTFTYGTLHLSNYLSLRGRSALYGLIFAKMHVVQDAFPGVAMLRVIDVRTNDIMRLIPSEFVRVPHRTAKAFFIKCDEVEGFVETIPDLSKCKQAGLFNSGAVLSDVYAWSHLMTPYLSEVPASLFVLTSLFLTVAFYICFGLFLMSARLGRLFVHLTFTKSWIAVEKNPFATSALVLFAVAMPFLITLLLAINFTPSLGTR